jgi:hypothetical protein
MGKKCQMQGETALDGGEQKSPEREREREIGTAVVG